MIKNYLKIAVRHLWKNRTFSLINLLGLTIGVGACVMIYLIVSFELGYDTFHPDKEQIYRVVGDFKFGAREKGKWGFVVAPVPLAMREEMTGLEYVAAFHNWEAEVKIQQNGQSKIFEKRNFEKDPSEIIIAEPSYFQIFNYQWLAGSPEQALNEPFKVVLSEKKARKYFGEGSIESYLGREVIYQDSLRLTVTGIVQDMPANSNFTFTDFISFSTIKSSFLKKEIPIEDWQYGYLTSQAFVKLAKGTSAEQINAQFPNFIKKYSKWEAGIVWNMYLQALPDLHFNTDYQDTYSRQAHLPTLYGLIGIALFILLIAAINFINFATAQSSLRAKEIGIRKVMGGSRKGLVLRFIGETFILTSLAVLASFLLIEVSLPLLNEFLPRNFSYQLFSIPNVLALGVIIAITTLLSGFYPSWVLSAYQPAHVLKGKITDKSGSAYLRKSLIVFQFTISLIFILGSMLVSRQITFMFNKDLGFKTEAIISLWTTHISSKSQLAVFSEKVKQLSGVKNATLQAIDPMGENFLISRVYHNQKTKKEFSPTVRMGDENFISLYEMRLVAGRSLEKSDSTSGIVINQKFAKELGFQTADKALGEVLEWNKKNYAIVGVIADFHQQGMKEKIPSTFITCNPEQLKNIAIKLKDRDLSKAKLTIAQIENIWKEVYPNQKFSFSFLDDSIAKLYEKERKTAKMIHLATFITILIACLGLFGLATFTAERRIKEIGIRKVLGASTLQITALLSKDFLKLVIIAFVVASPIAYYFMYKWLAHFAYRISISWWIFVLAGGSAIGIAFITVSWQSIKAALVNPVKSLRSE